MRVCFFILMKVKWNMIMEKCKNNRGFTLLEIMIVISIMCVLMAVGIVSFTEYMPSYRLKVTARLIRNDFQRARTLAAKNNKQYRVVFSQGDMDAPAGDEVYQVQKGNSTRAITWSSEFSRTSEDYEDVTIPTPSQNPIFNPNGTIEANTISTITLENSSGSMELTMTVAGMLKVAE